MAVDDYVRFFGRRFAPGWEELRGQPVVAVARTVALNAVSVGSTLRSLLGDEANAEVLIEGWPDEEIAGVLGLAPSDGEAMWDSFEPIMEHLGIGYSWRRADGAVRLSLKREGTRSNEHLRAYAQRTSENTTQAMFRDITSAPSSGQSGEKEGQSFHTERGPPGGPGSGGKVQGARPRD